MWAAPPQTSARPPAKSSSSAACVPTAAALHPQPEHYDGVNYYTYDLRKVLLFPQQTGQLTIEPMSCDVIVRVRSAQQRPRSFFDDFFDTYQEVSKPIATSKLNIQVEPLPTPRPSDFSGLVGKLALTQKVSVTEVEANQPITITLKSLASDYNITSTCFRLRCRE
mgnify:CR=1 FL=1